ncbi:MAG TPA: hypothetical protein VNN13_09720 [Methylomirabilota bacterium]|nr:hypothetical protein [Methylomirabilota bacterium]
MSAPQHTVLLLPFTAWADKSARDIEAIRRVHGIELSEYLVNRAVNLSPDVIQIQTDKTHTLNPGRFVVRFVPRGEAKLIQPHDLVLIKLNAGDQSSRDVSIMVGLVMRVTNAVRVSDRQAIQHIEIHGQDLARWLYVNRNFFYFYTGMGMDAKDGPLELKERERLWQSLFPNRGQANLPSAKVLENILIDYIGRIFPRVGEVFTWHPVFTESTEAKFKSDDPVLGLGERYIPRNDLAAYSGSVANLLEEHVLDYFGELWADTTPAGGFRLYYRRRPFDQSDWQSFRPHASEETRQLHEIPDDQILMWDIGKNDDEYYNFISILPWIYATDTSIMPLVMKSALRLDVGSIKNRGLRPLLVSAPYLDSVEDISRAKLSSDYNALIQHGAFVSELVRGRVPASQIESTVSQVQALRGRVYQVADEWGSVMWRWYSQLDRYYNGRIVIKGNPSIRVGHIVKLLSDTHKLFPEPYCFYVLSVSHDYDVHIGRYTTSLALGRGQAADPAKFVKPVTDGRADIADLDLEKLEGRLQNSRILNHHPFTGLDAGVIIEGQSFLELSVGRERDLQ